MLSVDKFKFYFFHLVLLAPVLNIYGINGLGFFDIIILISFPAVIYISKYTFQELSIILLIPIVSLILAIFGENDIIGLVQFIKLYLYILYALSIKRLISKGQIYKSAINVLYLVSFFFIIQYALSWLGIYESFVFPKLGMVNSFMASADLDHYMELDTRYTSLFAEPAHLAVWLLFIFGILTSIDTVSKVNFVVILGMLILSGSSFGIGFAAIISFIYFDLKTKATLVSFLSIILSILLLDIGLTTVIDYLFKLIESVPQIYRLIENNAAIDGRIADISTYNMSLPELIFGKGFTSTSGYLTFFNRMTMWGGFTLLCLIIGIYVYQCFSSKSTKYLSIPILVLVFMSGILSTVTIMLLFVMCSEKERKYDY